MSMFESGTAVNEIAELARDAIHGRVVSEIDCDDDFLILRGHDGAEQHFDLESIRVSPRRSKGNVVVHSADAFLASIRQLVGDPAAPPEIGFDELGVYADEEHSRLVAIVNDDSARAAGWRDHRIVLDLRPTPEWKLWKAGQGLTDQDVFATIIEDGQDEIRDPDPATMLELAQTLHSTTRAKFKSGSRLSDGARQFLYDEDVSVTAGSKGQITVPSEFRIAVRPFYGGDKFEVTCRLRTKQVGPAFSIGYTLVKPAEVERVAFMSIRQIVAGAIPGIIDGVAPEART
jgi:uncharacterized protein YfdQ (DUF2303 family)